MKVGDIVTAQVNNGTPDGLKPVGEILEINDTTALVSTQFGVNMRLAVESLVPVDGGNNG